MNLLGLDFETNGDDPRKSNVTEIGAVFLKYEPSTKIFTRIKTLSMLVYHPDYPPQSEKIIEITGITDQMLKDDGVLPMKAFTELLEFMKPAQIVMAHNTVFDRAVFESSCDQLKLAYPKPEWICTYVDVPYPAKYACKKLAHLALDHGIKMDHRELHRAVNDVNLMLELVTTKYDIEKILEYAREPWVYLQAKILGPWQGPGGDGGVQKNQAQKLGFSWERCKHLDEPVFPKTWVCRLKKSLVKEFIARAPFQIIELGGFNGR